MNKKLKIIDSVGFGAVAAVIFVVFATIVAELFSSFKDFLKEFSGHHWTSKGIFAFLVFLAVSFLAYFCQKKTNLDKTAKILFTLGYVSVLGSLAIFGFYLWHYFL
ncbi:MAG: hypothetical protein AAB926_00280 [Patescibacteria group bacterium]